MHQIEHFELATPQPASLKLDAGCVIRVTHGRLWLTRPDHHEDVWLQSSECWTLPTTGTVWLSAEPVVQFQLAHALTGLRGSRLANLRRQMLEDVKTHLRAVVRSAGSQLPAGTVRW